ncbi:hypothetical protein [Embleya sp. NPDC005971]|uniref:hypothetical protein n=1 Tax=Embleya sp. NPDC005971 TaxID=3156724 RepID=UPI0033DC6906
MSKDEGSFTHRYFGGLIGATNNTVGRDSGANIVSSHTDELTESITVFTRALASALTNHEHDFDEADRSYALHAVEQLQEMPLPPDPTVLRRVFARLSAVLDPYPGMGAYIESMRLLLQRVE